MATTSRRQKLPLQKDIDWRAALKERPFLGTFVLLARGTMLIAIVATFVIATALVVYALYEIYDAVKLLLTTKSDSKKITLAAVEAIDTFLLVTVLHVVAIGLYQLYIQDNIPIPEWLRVETIDDLKEKLAGVVIVVLAVFYLGRVITGDNPLNLLYLGGGVGIAIVSLALFLYAQYRKPEHKP
jgi:uncharacterized membrane protein YqhA